MKLITILSIVALLSSGGIAMAERLEVSSKIANIRSGPGTGYEILWKVERYHPIEVLEKNGRWVRFRDFESDEGWIHASLLGKEPTVITAKDKCNIRKGPGTSYEILFTVEKGIPFLIIDTRKNWLQIKHVDGDTGWIHKSLVW